MPIRIIETIQKFVADDTRLAHLVERGQEHAELYLMAKQRQKGCDGMGEVATLKDEFVYSLNGIIRHCEENGYFPGEISYEIDDIAHGMCGVLLE